MSEALSYETLDIVEAEPAAVAVEPRLETVHLDDRPEVDWSWGFTLTAKVAANANRPVRCPWAGIVTLAEAMAAYDWPPNLTAEHEPYLISIVDALLATSEELERQASEEQSIEAHQPQLAETLEDISVHSDDSKEGQADNKSQTENQKVNSRDKPEVKNDQPVKVLESKPPNVEPLITSAAKTLPIIKTIKADTARPAVVQTKAELKPAAKQPTKKPPTKTIVAETKLTQPKKASPEKVLIQPETPEPSPLPRIIEEVETRPTEMPADKIPTMPIKLNEIVPADDPSPRVKSVEKKMALIQKAKPEPVPVAASVETVEHQPRRFIRPPAEPEAAAQPPAAIEPLPDYLPEPLDEAVVIQFRPNFAPADEPDVIEQPLAELAEIVDELPPETAIEVSQVIKKLIELPQPEEQANDQLQPEAEILFNELFNLVNLTYPPETIQLLGRRVSRLEAETIVALIREIKVEAHQAVATREIINGFLLGLRDKNKMLAAAPALGQSALRLYQLAA